jgi:hypothetical protein
MTSTKNGSQVGGYRSEVEQQKLGPALVIASSLILAIRTARWPTTHSDGLANMEWEKEVEHSVRAIFATIYPFVISASLDCRGLPKIVGMLSGKQNVALSTLQDACVSSETIGR